ncbi:allergen Tha p 1-like [Danaus plexippus]|uniref:allergen Tha p 1-like n=1 Tax=Danaus plexippus TaxID=13037 RepID=UPI002AB31652|nr:allergen Tha p 1-like [Danaus plexippus]
MKTIIFLAVIAFAVADPEFYNVATLDMDKMKKDPLEFKRLVDCLLDRQPCTPVYSTYRAIVQEAIERTCMKCSPIQKKAFWQFLQALRTIAPKDYDHFRQKYDADNRYFDILELILSGYADWH